MNDTVVISALISGIAGLFTLTTYLVKRMLDRQDKLYDVMRSDLATCSTQKDAMKDEAKATLATYYERDRKDAQVYRESRRKGSGP